MRVQITVASAIILVVSITGVKASEGLFKTDLQLVSQPPLVTVLPADGNGLAAAGVRPGDIAVMRTRLSGDEATSLAAARQSSLDQVTLASQQARQAELKLARNPFDREAKTALATARTARKNALASFNDLQAELRSLAMDAVGPERAMRVMACSTNASKGLDGADVALSWSPDRALELTKARRIEARCERHGEAVPDTFAGVIRDAESDFGRSDARVNINIHAAEIDRLLRQ